MQVQYLYKHKSQMSSDGQQADLSFAPDGLRPPTFFVGQLKNNLSFREAISALHHVVSSDMRYQPRNLDEYKRWLAAEEQHLLAEMLQERAAIQTQVAELSAELKEMNQYSSQLLHPFHQARQQYFNYLYKENLAAWYVLDPVITVHPDEIFFECFSEDESSYGKLSCSYDTFEQISDQAYGTTNIDYSEGLYNEFQKIRDYRQTQLKIDPDGFNLQTSGEESFDEKKIDLPDSWVRGFLQVSSAMTLPLTHLTLQPMDIHNLCFKLRRRKERVGPRSLRFELTPGQPIRIVLEPWNEVVNCPRSIYQGQQAQTIRIWGRRRLHILERLIPLAKQFNVYLLGSGMPSFYVADLGGMRFTLGLSGWTANDWSRQGNFDLLASREEVDETTLRRVYQGLSENWCESSRSLSARLQLDETVVKSALAQYSQQGLVLYDLATELYRIRALCREPLPFEQLRFRNERESKALRFVAAALVTVKSVQQQAETEHFCGTVMDNAVNYLVSFTLDCDQRLIAGECQCYFYQQNRLRKGPCEHILALREATKS